MTEKQIQKLTGRLVEHQDLFGELSTKDRQWIIQNPSDAIALMCKAVAEREEEESQIIRLVVMDLAIPSTDGTLIITGAEDVFAWIDDDFGGWGADELGEAAEEIFVAVYEMAEDASFVKMFEELASDVSDLCLPQAQIIEFVKEHRQHLRQNGYATFFLFRSHNQFFVTLVRVHPDGRLQVDVHRFEDPAVWHGSCGVRLVVPQLAVA